MPRARVASRRRSRGQSEAPVLSGARRQVCDVDEPGPAQEDFPRLGVHRVAVEQVSPRGLPPARRAAGGLGDDDERGSACQHRAGPAEQRHQCVEREPVDDAAQHNATERPIGTPVQDLGDLGDRHRAALLECAQRDAPSGLDAARAGSSGHQGAKQRTLPAVRVEQLPAG